jgi:CMP-N-acetylneuraminic acid synthetase
MINSDNAKLQVFAIIPARGGSKGIPRKNVQSIAGKPLLAWTIIAAKKSMRFHHIVVSTEDREIATIAREWEAEVLERPIELASDTSPTYPLLEHFVDNLLPHQDAILVLLQPTSPLRTASHVEEALDLFINSRADCLISVYEPRHTPCKAFIQDHGGFLHGLMSEEAPYQRRQDLPRAFQPNGAIFIFKARELIRQGRIPVTRVVPYIMPESDSLDVDTWDDLRQVEYLLELAK